MSLALKPISPLKDMAKLRLFRVTALLSLLLWLGNLGLLLIRAVPVIYGKTAVPLHYNIHVGVDNVGPWWRIFLAPGLGLLVFLVNLFLARYMWSRDPELAYVIAIATVLVEFVMLVAVVFIVYLTLQYA